MREENWDDSQVGRALRGKLRHFPGVEIRRLVGGRVLIAPARPRWPMNALAAGAGFVAALLLRWYLGG